MSYLGLTKKIMQDELTEEELMDCLDILNIPVLQHTILKIAKNNYKNEYIKKKLIKYTGLLDVKYKIIGLYTLGHLSIYALNALGYSETYHEIYDDLSDFDKELVITIEKALG